MTSRNRKRAVRVLALCGVGGLFVFLSEGACASHAPDEPMGTAGAGGSGNPRDSGSDSGKGGLQAGDARDASVCSTPDTLLPSVAPAGWSWAPCIPETCNIVVSPDPAHANPPPDWTSCGSG